MNLSDQDRDMIIRTIIGEAGDQSDIGKAAVAHVVFNRTAVGQWGDNPTSVVLARNQFEPWSTRRRELLSINPQSDQYRKVGQIVDSVAGGQIADPTGGSTHFLDPTIVRRRRGGSLPDWAQGQGIPIGDHIFYAPNGPQNGIAAINSAMRDGGRLPAAALAFADEPGSTFRDAGFDVPKKVESKYAVPGQMFKDAGFDLPTAKPAPAEPVSPPGTPMMVDMSTGTPRLIPVPQPQADKRGVARRVYDEFSPGFGNPLTETYNAASSANALRASGMQDIREGKYWPSFPSRDPQTWSGGGLLKTAAGALGIPLSPVTGTFEAGVRQPVDYFMPQPPMGPATDFSGRIVGPPPQIASLGERSAFLPGGFLGRKLVVNPVRNALSPSLRATNALVEAIGPENVPAVVKKLSESPRNTLADVSEPVRLNVQGVIGPEQPAAINAVKEAVAARQATRPSMVNSAYTEAMGPAPDTRKMVEALKDRARDAGRKAIQPALDAAKPVDVSPVIKDIDAAVKPGISALADPSTKLPLSDLQQELVRFKQRLASESGETLFDAKRLHSVQSDMGDYIYQLSRSPDAKQRYLASQLRQFNEKLIDQIDAAAGGKYRPARAKFKDAKDIEDAWDRGFDTLKNRSGKAGLEDRPEAFAEWMKNASPEEIDARRIGTRADIDQKIRSVANQTLAADKITRIEYNQEKLKKLFGDAEANRLIGAMNRASNEAATDYEMLRGSKTAATTAFRESRKPRQVAPLELGRSSNALFGPVLGEIASSYVGGTPGLAAAAMIGGGVIKAGAKNITQRLGRASDIATNVAIARSALAAGPARQQVTNALLSHPKVRREIKKQSNALAVP